MNDMGCSQLQSTCCMARQLRCLALLELTFPPETSPLEVRVLRYNLRSRRTRHEKQPVQLGANHRDSEARRGWGQGDGPIPPTRHLRSYLLPLEVQIWGYGGLRGQEAQSHGRGEPPALRLIAERVGHSDPSLTLKVYSHLMPGAQIAAADAFAIDLSLCETKRFSPIDRMNLLQVNKSVSMRSSGHKRMELGHFDGF